jgi:hypothetical protein
MTVTIISLETEKIKKCVSVGGKFGNLLFGTYQGINYQKFPPYSLYFFDFEFG